MTLSCVTLAESLPSPKPQLLSVTADASAASHKVQFLGIPHFTHTPAFPSFRDSPRLMAVCYPLTWAGGGGGVGVGTPALQPWLLAQGNAPPLRQGALLTVPEFTYFFFFIFFFGFITCREKQLLFESSQGRFRAPSRPGCGWLGQQAQQGMGATTAWEGLCQAS